jgi:hypothetical protein
MQIVAKLELDDVEKILEKRGIGTGRKVQKFIDTECIDKMKPYTPNLNGVLSGSATACTVIGSGKIIQFTPYARYQYYGQLMVDPITLKGSFYDSKTGRHWSRPGVPKILDPEGRGLSYNVSKSPQAGPHWFERMAYDYRDAIGEGAADLAGGKFKK